MDRRASVFPSPGWCNCDTVFYKLQIGDKIFFAKKHLNERWMQKELQNICLVYDEIHPSKLLQFYGVSKKFGFIYEWVDNFTYEGKTSLQLKSKTLGDVDIININGKPVFIDFWE